MRIRAEQARDADRGCAGVEHDAPVPVSAPSADPVREALSALRAARRRAGTAVEAAVEALEARATEPFSASVDLSFGPPRIAGEPRELDAKDSSARAGNEGPAADPLARPLADPPWRLHHSPDTRLLTLWLHGPSWLVPHAGRDAERERGEADEPIQLPELTIEAKLPEPHGRPRFGPGERDRHQHGHRQEREAARSAGERKKAIDKQTERMKRGPLAKPDAKKPPGQDKNKDKLADKAKKLPDPPQPKQPPPKQDKAEAKGGGGSGGSDRAAAWAARATAKAQTVEAPQVDDASRYVFEYTEASTRHSGQTPQQKLDLIASAEKAVPPIEKWEDGELKLPVPDPLPTARLEVEKLCGKSLPPQSLPDLVPSPLKSIPQLKTWVYTDDSGGRHVMRETKPGQHNEILTAGPDGKLPEPVKFARATEVVDTKKKLDGKAKGSLADKVADLNAKEPANLDPKGNKRKGAQLTHEKNDMPKQGPKLPPLEGIPKVDTRKVIAKVMATIDPSARTIADAARLAYPGGSGLPGDFMGDFIPEIKRDLAKEMRKVAGACATAGNALDTKTDAELTQLETDTQANLEAANAALDTSYKGEKLRYDATMEFAGGLLDDIERRIDDMAAIGEGGFDPDAVKKEQKSVLDANELVVTTWQGRYKTLGENRVKELVTAKTEQERAYEATAELDKLKLRAYVDDKTSDADKKAEKDKETEIDQWLTDQRLNLKKVVGPGNNSLIDESVAKIREYKKALGDQADAYVKVVNEWADKRLGIEKHWWNKLIDWVRSVLGISKKNKKTWEERSTADNKAVSDKNELELAKLITTQTEKLTKEQIADRKDLNEVQKAMLTSWFVDAPGDSVAALAAGLIASIRGQWQGHLNKEIEDKVLRSPFEIVMAVSDATGVRRGDLHARATKIYSKGFKGAGTKKNEVYEGMGGLTRVQARALEMYYELVWPKRSLKFDAIDELFDIGDQITGSTGDVTRAFTMLEGTAPGTDAYYDDVAIQLYQAMRETAWGFGFGTNKAEIFKLMRGKTADERQRIRWAFKQRYGVELDDMVGGELDDGFSLRYDLERYQALGRGDTEKADAIGIRGAHGWEDNDPINKAINWALYKDVKEADQIYQDIRADVEREAKEAAAAGHPWDTKEFDRQLGKRLGSLDKTFGAMYGYEFDVKPGESALEAAHGKYFSHDKAKLLIGQRRQDFAMESAARISLEHKATILPDKDEVNKTLEMQYKRSFEERRRDLEAADIKAQQDEYYACTVKPKSNTKADIDAAKEATEANLKTWRMKWIDPIEKKKRARELDRKAETEARETTKTKMWDLKVAYEKDFATGSMFSTGTFEGDVYSATNVRWPWEGARTVDSDKTFALIAGSGYLDTSQQLLFGVKGGGTDEAAVHGAYAGRSKAEIDAAHKKLGERLEKLGIKDDPVAWVHDDFSGDELDDIRVEQMGEPITPEEKLAVERERVRLQKESISNGWFGGLREWIASDEIDGMNMQLASLEADIKALEDEKAKLRAAGIQPGDEKWYDKLAKFYDNIDKSAANVKTAVGGARASLQAALSWVTAGIQAIVTIGSIVAGILLTPVTGGASIAIAIAVVGALVTTAATMAAKAIILGGAYGWEDMVTDLAMGLVEALVAGLTAGYGGKIIGALGLAKKPAENMVAAFVRKSVAHFVTGAIQATPGAIIGTVIHGGGISDILGQILQAGLMSVAMGTLTDPIVEHFQTGKALKARTDPDAFERAFKQFQGEHPKATRADLRAELDKMLASHGAALRDPALQKTMRAELLEGLPPGQRKAFENAKIEVVNERDFARAAGKGSEDPAVVVMKNGAPTVVVKAGADISALGKLAPQVFEPPQAAATKLARPTAAETTTTPVAPPVAQPPPKVAPPPEELAPRPRGASASPDPLAPDGPAGPARKLVLEPFAGPKLDSPIELAHRNPNAQVVATEATIKPPPGEVARASKAGVAYVPDNKPGHIGVGTVDEIKMRFPIPHERAMQQDFIRRLGELETLHPNKPRGELLQQAMHDTIHHAESLTGYGPYALERLKVGGRMEVVFWEKSVIGELGDVGRMRFVDPATGKGYRLELVDLQLRPRGEVAPHSGFGIPEMTHATDVHVARFEKVELGSKLPTGARGPDIVEGVKIGEHSGRPFSPRDAGGPVRELDYRNIKFTEKAIDVVEGHIRRFDGGGEMELAMVDRLRRIARGEIPATDFDRAFYSHELRESVRYRILGHGEGQPIDPAKAYEIWNNAHSATLEDYKIRERLPGGGRALFHPEVVAKYEPGPRPTGAGGPSHHEALATRMLNAEGELHPDTRKLMTRELKDLGVSRAELRTMTDRELATRFLEAQVTEAPKRTAAYRETLAPEARTELDAIHADPELHTRPIDKELAGRLGKALEMPVQQSETLGPGGVRVSADGKTLLVGPGATVADVLGHIGTIGAVKRYQGALGMVRRVADAVGRVFGRGGPPFGTIAHEAWREIQKLPGIMETSRARLLDADVDPLTRRELIDKIARIEDQLLRHMSELGDMSPGRGYIEMEGGAKPRPIVKGTEHIQDASGAHESAQPMIDKSKFPSDVQPALKERYVFEARNWVSGDADALPKGDYLYILRDAETGEILKVGKTSNKTETVNRAGEPAESEGLHARMSTYKRASSAAWDNRPVQVELYRVEPPDGVLATTLETKLRVQLYDNHPGAKQQFAWDNAVPHNAVREGPGTPGELPKGKEKIKVISRDGDTIEVEIQNDKKTRQKFSGVKPDEPLASLPLDTEVKVSRRHLLVWERVPPVLDASGAVIKRAEWKVTRRGTPVGERRVLSPLEQLKVATPQELEKLMIELFKQHRGETSSKLVKAVGAHLGIDWTSVYPYLNKLKRAGITLDPGEYIDSKKLARGETLTPKPAPKAEPDK